MQHLGQQCVIERHYVYGGSWRDVRIMICVASSLTVGGEHTLECSGLPCRIYPSAKAMLIVLHVQFHPLRSLVPKRGSGNNDMRLVTALARPFRVVNWTERTSALFQKRIATHSFVTGVLTPPRTAARICRSFSIIRLSNAPFVPGSLWYCLTISSRLVFTSLASYKVA